MYIDAEGKKWFKGNLHTHTTRSDGKKSFEDCAALYESNGYDFLCITDHWRYHEDTRYRDMLILSGCEYDTGNLVREGVYHIVSIGAAGDIIATRESSAQEIIDAVHDQGGLAMLAHPAWSLNSPDCIQKLKNLDLSEIFNSVSDLPRNARPYSGLIFDMLASRGEFITFTAVDDVHFYEKNDTCRSFIYVNAEECTKEAIISAIKTGNFYCSQGPCLKVFIENGKLIVNTTPVEEIVYYTDTVYTPERSQFGKDLVRGEYTMRPTDTFVRVEVKDKYGKYAWSQYVRL